MPGVPSTIYSVVFDTQKWGTLHYTFSKVPTRASLLSVMRAEAKKTRGTPNSLSYLMVLETCIEGLLLSQKPLGFENGKHYQAYQWGEGILKIHKVRLIDNRPKSKPKKTKTSSMWRGWGSSW